MCKCTPNITTLYCGKLGCEWPKEKPFSYIPKNVNKVRPWTPPSFFENDNGGYEIEHPKLRGKK
jgi:hypothetical protein